MSNTFNQIVNCIVYDGKYPSNCEVLSIADQKNERKEILELMAREKICKVNNYQTFTKTSCSPLTVGPTFTMGGDVFMPGETKITNVQTQVYVEWMDEHSAAFSKKVAVACQDRIAAMQNQEAARKVAEAREQARRHEVQQQEIMRQQAQHIKQAQQAKQVLPKKIQPLKSSFKDYGRIDRENALLKKQIECERAIYSERNEKANQIAKKYLYRQWEHDESSRKSCCFGFLSTPKPAPFDLIKNDGADFYVNNAHSPVYDVSPSRWDGAIPFPDNKIILKSGSFCMTLSFKDLDLN